MTTQLKKSYFFRNGRPPPLLNGPAIKKITFFCDFTYEKFLGYVTLVQDFFVMQHNISVNPPVSGY